MKFFLLPHPPTPPSQKYGLDSLFLAINEFINLFILHKYVP